MAGAPRPLVVTISAAYGAGGSVVGPRVAEALGVPFFDRAIPVEVAERLSMPLEEAVRGDESPPAAFDRLLRPFATLGTALAGTAPIPPFGDETVSNATEQVIREQADRAGGVILGRAGAIVLRERPGALHVRLTGPAERRLEQAMRIEGIDHDTAARRQEQADHAREAYVKYFYGCSARDPALYHLCIDSTAIAIAACVDLVVGAARGLQRI